MELRVAQGGGDAVTALPEDEGAVVEPFLLDRCPKDGDREQEMHKEGLPPLLPERRVRPRIRRR